MAKPLHQGLPRVHIRLTRKLAEMLNGVDLRGFTVGEVLQLDERLAAMLMAEGWAEAVTPLNVRATADDRRRSRGRRPSSPGSKKTC